MSKSKELKLTEWFPGHIKPVRKGVYQQMTGSYLGYQYWDGQLWGRWSETPAGAYDGKSEPASSKYQNDPWRGILKD